MAKRIEKTHALLSASSSHRWLECTPSARIEEMIPCETVGKSAKEGTLAHSLAELILTRKYKGLDSEIFNQQLGNIKSSEYYNSEMLEHILGFETFVGEEIGELSRITEDVQILLEERLDFSKYVPEGFGTGDVVLIADGVIHIIDLKYGKGVYVSAENNTQMKLYALGALTRYDILYNVQKIKTTIYQSRKDNISSFEIDVENLKKWGEEEVKPQAELAFDGGGKFKAGEHCRFCKAKATCRALAEENLKLLKYEFKKGDKLTNEELSDILKIAGRLKNWVKGMESYAIQKALSGVKFDGIKVVEGKSDRIYRDEDEILKILLDTGLYREDELMETKLIGVAKLEKVVTKKRLKELVGELVIKPIGKPTLVPISDKRAEYNSAKIDFRDVILENKN